MKNAVKQRFLQLEPRQQAVAATGIAIAVLLVAAGVLAGLHERQQQARNQLLAAAAVLAEVNELSAALGSLQAGTSNGDDLTAIVTRSLQSFGLQPSRLQQNAPDELQLRIDSIGFGDAVAWLAMLEQTPGVTLVRVSMTNAKDGASSLVATLRGS